MKSFHRSLSGDCFLLALCFLLSYQALPGQQPIGRIENWTFGCGTNGSPFCEYLLDSVKADGYEFPVQLSFALGREKGLFLPQGWNITVIEPRAYESDEATMKVFLLDGGGELWPKEQSSKKEADYAIVNGAEVDLKRSGLDYKFRNGLLEKIMVNNKTIIHYVYNSKGGLELIKDSRGGSILLIQNLRTGPVGKLQLTFPVTSKKFIIEYADTISQNGRAIEGYQDLAGVSKVTELSNNSSILIDMNLFPDLERMKLLVSSKGKGVFERPLLELVWNTATKRLEKANDSVISYFDLNHKNDPLYQPAISLTDTRSNTTDVFQVGIHEVQPMLLRKFTESETHDTYYLKTPRGVVVRREVLNGVESYKAYFDVTGNVIRDERNGFIRLLKNGKYYVYKDGKLLNQY